MAEKSTKKMSFEQSLARLEEILHTLESGEGGLDATLKLYEEGVGLIRSCNEQLEKAEQSVKMLQIKPNGIALTDFMPSED